MNKYAWMGVAVFVWTGTAGAQEPARTTPPPAAPADAPPAKAPAPGDAPRAEAPAKAPPATRTPAPANAAEGAKAPRTPNATRANVPPTNAPPETAAPSADTSPAGNATPSAPAAAAPPAGASGATKPAASPRAGPSDEALLDAAIAERRDSQGRRCELRATARSGTLRYLACGEAGVWVLRFAAGRGYELVEQRPTTGMASGFFVRNGVLWVETTTIQAERLAPVEANATIHPEAIAGSIAPAAAAVVPQASAARPSAPVDSSRTEPLAPSPYYRETRPASDDAKPVRRGGLRYDEFEPEPARVVGLESGFAVIDMGSAHGVTAGDHVAFERLTKERIDAEHSTERRDRVAVGKAHTVGRTRTRVALGIGEQVEVGMRARPTRDPVTASSFAPPRIGGVWHAGFLARPFLIVDNFGVGLAMEGRAGYRAELPMHFEVLAKPIAFGTGREGAVPAVGAVVTASFDTRLFEVGLGIGGQTVNDPAFDLETGSGTTIAQRLRIGAVDGGMLEVFTYIVLFHSEFEFSDIHAHGQLPVGDHSWLILNAGGGSLGLGWADIGLRVMLEGDGREGSLFLSATIGGVHMFEATFDPRDGINFDAIDYTGPMAGVGAEWRF